jgi:hypothetical protein
MEYQTCKICKIEKKISSFKLNKKICCDCENKIARDKRAKAKTDSKTLTNAEISGLREILIYKDIIMHNNQTIKNNDIIPETITDNNAITEKIKSFDKTDRNKVTYNVDVSLRNELTNYCKSNLFSCSDIVNVAISQYLQRYNKK